MTTSEPGAERPLAPKTTLASDGSETEVARADEPSNVAQSAPSRASGRRNLLGDYLSMVGFNGLSIALSFLNTSVLLSLMGRAGYGEIIAMTTAPKLLAMLFGAWSHPTISRQGTEELKREGRIRKTFWCIVTIVLAGVAAMLVASPLWLATVIEQLAVPESGGRFLLAYFALNALWLQFQFTLPVTGRQRWLYPLFCLERLLILATILVMSACGYLSVITVLGGHILGISAIIVAGFVILAGVVGPPCRTEAKKLRLALRDALYMAPSVWSHFLNTNSLDYLFVKRFMGSSELGVYALGVQIAGMVQQLVIVGAQLMSPRIVRWRLERDHARLLRYVQGQFTPLLWLWCLLGLLATTLVAVVGPLYIPPNYLLLTRLAWPLMVSTALVPVWSLLWAPMITAFDRIPLFLIASFLAGVVNIGANLLLIPRYGSVGSSWATVISLTTSCVVAETITAWNRWDFPKRGPRLYLPVIATGLAGIVLSQLLA